MPQSEMPSTPSPSSWKADEILVAALQQVTGNALVLVVWVLAFAATTVALPSPRSCFAC